MALSEFDSSFWNLMALFELMGKSAILYGVTTTWGLPKLLGLFLAKRALFYVHMYTYIFLHICMNTYTQNDTKSPPIYIYIHIYIYSYDVHFICTVFLGHSCESRLLCLIAGKRALYLTRICKKAHLAKDLYMSKPCVSIRCFYLQGFLVSFATGTYTQHLVCKQDLVYIYT